MADFSLPMPNIGLNKEQSVDNLLNLMIKYRKELQYILNNLDDANISSLSADRISAGTIDADLVTITNLVVGSNVTMGANAVITWGNLPLDVADTGVVDGVQADVDRVYDALGSVSSTYISGTEIRSPEIKAGAFYGSKFYDLDGGNFISMDSPNGFGDFTIYRNSTSPVLTLTDMLDRVRLSVFDISHNEVPLVEFKNDGNVKFLGSTQGLYAVFG